MLAVTFSGVPAARMRREASEVADPLGPLGRLVGGGDGQGDDELLAAVAGDEVVGPGCLAENAGDLAEDGVADLVAVGVVDPLEVVDVEHQDGHPQSLQPAPVGQGAELGEEEGPIVEAGQGVAHGPLEHLALELLLAGVGPDELDDHGGAELEPVAVLRPGPACSRGASGR